MVLFRFDHRWSRFSSCHPGVIILVLHIAVEIEMAELFDVLDKELLDVDVGVGVVLSHEDAQETFWPCDQNSFGELGSQNGLHAFSEAPSMKGHMLVVEVQECLGIFEHLVDCVAIFFGEA